MARNASGGNATIRRLAAVTAIVLLGVALAFVLRPRQRLLMDRATKVASNKVQGALLNDFYWWVSDHKVVIPIRSNNGFESLYCHDTNTGQDDPCVELNTLIKAQKAVPRILSLSPDRRTLLFLGDNDRQIGATMDGRLMFVDKQTPNTRFTEPDFESHLAGGSIWVEPILAWKIPHNIRESHIARLLVHNGTMHTVVKTVSFSPWLEQGHGDMVTTRNHFLMTKPSASGGLFYLPSDIKRFTTDHRRRP